MSRAERRAAKQEPVAVTVVVEHAPWQNKTLSGFGVDNVPGSHTKFFAYECSTDGKVRLLTPLRNGKLVGEGQPNATGRVKLAWLKRTGGVE